MRAMWRVGYTSTGDIWQFYGNHEDVAGKIMLLRADAQKTAYTCSVVGRQEPDIKILFNILERENL
jgi:hypothetical protein